MVSFENDKDSKIETFLAFIEHNDMEYGNGAYNDGATCPLLVNGTVILFGGQKEKRQVSVVFPFGVKRINTLTFDFVNGRCYFNNGVVFLGFSYAEKDQSRKR